MHNRWVLLLAHVATMARAVKHTKEQLAFELGVEETDLVIGCQLPVDGGEEFLEVPPVLA